jgi:hypothetical protein
MASGDSGISICSDALTLLGAKPISSFTEGTDAANVCDRLYTTIKNQTLMNYPWSFSFKKEELQRLATAPTTEYDYQYALPADRIGNPRKVFNSTTTQATVNDYRILTGALLTNETEVYADFQYAVAEVDFPHYFVQLLRYMMAWHLAIPITDQVETSDYFRQVAVGTPSENNRGGYMRTAITMDAQGQPSSVIADYALTAVRG